MDPVQKPILDSFLKRPTAQSRKATSSLLITRPIATNSRVKQDEQYRKDMYLAFVNNALQQKANVRFFFEEHMACTRPIDVSYTGEQRALR